MSIELAKKHFVELKKEASDVVEMKGLGDQKARVALAIDISTSMTSLFRNGTVQEVCEKLLALGVKFDDNAAIDVFLFGHGNYEAAELKESEFYGYVQSKLEPRYPLEPATNYAGVMDRIMKKYYPNSYGDRGFLKSFFGKKEDEPQEPVFVIFVTDGDNADRSATENIVIESSKYGIFWQFVGIGNASFSTLKRLDDLQGKYIDNADFFQLDDIGSVSDKEIYNRLLNEFPAWTKQAKNKNLIV